ncbi:hypothetical protein [Anaeroarcus burkinensis]|uniref:hypothetical protein n=1 Tax=Anaeroarcus burkinensis TaxID=82376 RepID=UPI0012DC167A|nr:hypothetical protein [Anaeroarcus burkinensis]
MLAVGSKTRCRGCSRRTAAREGAAQGAQQTSEYLYHTVDTGKRQWTSLHHDRRMLTIQ